MRLLAGRKEAASERGELVASGLGSELLAEGPSRTQVCSQEHVGPKGLETTQPKRQLLKGFGQGRIS